MEVFVGRSDPFGDRSGNRADGFRLPCGMRKPNRRGSIHAGFRGIRERVFDCRTGAACASFGSSAPRKVPVLDGLLAQPVAFMVRRDGLPLLRKRFENHHSSMICAVDERRRGCSGSKIPGSGDGEIIRGRRWKIAPSYQEEFTLFNPGGSIVVAG